MKTTKQLADTLGIDKQKVYRYIKKHNIKEAHQSGSTLYYDEAVEVRISQEFSISTTSSEARQSTSEAYRSASSDTVVSEVIAMLKEELSAKNKLIDEQQQTIKELNETIKIQAQSINAAHHNELAETIIDGQRELPAPSPEKLSLWSKIFKRKG
jgi:predicted transcriptional regulator YheO